MKTKKELSKKAFADQAIHTSCDAFFREDFFDYSPGKYGYAGGEYYPELSCNMEPIPEPGDRMCVQGTFHFLNNSASDLWLVCSHFADIGKDYFVFFNVSETSGWVVWTPNSEHYNK